MRVQSTGSAMRLREICLDSWALFRTEMRRSSGEKAREHLCAQLAASTERSPPG